MRIGTIHVVFRLESNATQSKSMVQISMHANIAVLLQILLLVRFFINKRITMNMLNRLYAIREKPNDQFGGSLNVFEFG